MSALRENWRIVVLVAGADWSLGGRPFAWTAPLTTAVTTRLGPVPAVLLAVALLFGSLHLFDRLLAAVDTTTVRRRVFGHVEHTWRSFALGLFVTGASTSVAFVLSLVLGPLLLVAVPLMLIATILASVLLVLRQFIVVTVAVGAPFFAVLWYANWGPMKSISNFASTWLRMGVYALLVGPIIALVMRVFNVIATGGISASGDVASFYVSAALALIFPIVLFVVIWKTIGTKRTVGYLSLVVLAATAAGLLWGAIA